MIQQTIKLSQHFVQLSHSFYHTPLVSEVSKQFCCCFSRTEDKVAYILAYSPILVTTKKKNSVASVGERTIYRPSDRRLSAQLVPTFEDRECHVVSVTNPYGTILGFLDRSSYFFFQVAPQLYSRGWVAPFQTHYFSENLEVPGIEPGTSGSVARNSRPLDHRGGLCS
jgi:hypothetical protein